MVNVMRVHTDGTGAAKDESQVLTEGPEKSSE
jgi:hypothetical protein